MNLSRLLSSISKLALQTRRIHETSVIPFSLQLAPFSTNATQAKRNIKKKTTKDSSDKDDVSISELKEADRITGVKRPSEIPFQPRIANKVELIGKVGLPVERQELQGGLVAVSVLVQEKYSNLPQFWIPIIFQGDLAEVASTHLKQNETVHISGQLSGDKPSIKINEGQANVQVFAQSLSYVRDAGAEIDVSFKEEKESPVSFTEGKDKKINTSVNASWEDLVANPQNWYDYRMDKQNGLKKRMHPDFKNMSTKEGLWLNAAPEWLFERLNDSKFAAQNIGNYIKNNAGSKDNMWKDLVENPKDWWDNRTNKKTPKSPDFSKKTTKEGLWLDTAPAWVLERLSDSASSAKSEELWKDLVEYPDAWWDNRSCKKSPKQPDFKHKKSGEALWISETTPEWALSKLVAEKSKKEKRSYSFAANG